MHPDVHLVRTRPPILDVPAPGVDRPPGAPKVCTPSSAPLWEWSAPPPRRRWRVAMPPQIALAVVAAMSLFAIAFAVVVASSPSPQLPALPGPGEPVWCACWRPTAPEGKLSD
jgi:hypothetical protein